MSQCDVVYRFSSLSYNWLGITFNVKIHSCIFVQPFTGNDKDIFFIILQELWHEVIKNAQVYLDSDVVFIQINFPTLKKHLLHLWLRRWTKCANPAVIFVHCLLCYYRSVFFSRCCDFLLSLKPVIDSMGFVRGSIVQYLEAFLLEGRGKEDNESNVPLSSLSNVFYL